MSVLAIIVILLLIFIGVIHFYWAIGGKRGIELTIPTIENKRVINPSKSITFIVGVVIIGFALIAYILGFYDFNSKYIINLGWVVSIIFLFRAVGEFHLVGFFKKIKSSKFAKYDTKYYSPLCLFLSVAFAILTYMHIN